MNNPKSILFCGTSEIANLHEEHLKTNNPNFKLYKIELSKYYDSVENLFKLLSSLEAQRAKEYRFVKDRNRFIICRGFLKLLLSKETGLNISQIHFEKHSNHKPYFPLDTSLFFNVAHAGNFALIAIGDCELGVDIEFVDDHFDYNEILQTIFDEKEINHLHNSNNKNYSFYKFWTRKEAIVKAIGKGIDDDLLKIPVTDGSHSVHTSLVGDYKQINVFSFDVNVDYVGALAFTEELNDFDNITFYPLPTSDELMALIHSQ